MGLSTDEQFMREAMLLADQAQAAGEVPVGAIVVLEGEIIGRGFNQPLGQHDPSAHAEIMGLRDAATSQKNYRLTNAEVYVTLEPCAMCAGAMVHARIGRVIFGASDPKSGVLGGAGDLQAALPFNHRYDVSGGVLGDECGERLRTFFREKRQKGNT